MLRNGMPLPMVELVGGWKKMPATYLRTLAAEDAAVDFEKFSPADRLGEAVERQGQNRRRGQARGRL